MQLFFRTVNNGNNGKCVTIEVSKDDKLRLVKLKVQDGLDIEPNEQNLVFAGKALDDDEKKIGDYGIVEESTIMVVKKPKGDIRGIIMICVKKIKTS